MPGLRSDRTAEEDLLAETAGARAAVRGARPAAREILSDAGGAHSGLIPTLAICLCLAVSVGPAGDAVAGPEELLWATFLGGAGPEEGFDVAVDGEGHVWVTGFTESEDFPFTSGAYDTLVADREAFLARLSADGYELLLCTLLGGESWDEGYSLAVDGLGRVCLAGLTGSADFPLTTTALDSVLDGGSDAFLAVLDTGGELLYSTLLGGSGDEWCYQIAADDSGRLYAVGSTGSADFPVSDSAPDQTLNGASDAFVARLSPSLEALEYATFLGGSSDEYGWGIAVDDSGCASVAGYTFSRNFPVTPGAFDSTHTGPTDAFAARLSPDGSALRYATLLGGGFRDAARSIAVDQNGCALVTGYTYSSDFPVTPGAFQDSMGFFDVSAFVTRLALDGRALSFSTFLTGEETESGYGIAADDSGRAWVVGFTDSPDFPVTPGSFDEVHGGDRDAFLCLLDFTGEELVYSTYIGGTASDYAWDLALGPQGRVYCAGHSRSEDFPVSGGAIQESFAGDEDIIVAALQPGYQVPVAQGPEGRNGPTEFLLFQNWPNPFNASTRICFRLPDPGPVSTEIFNAAGQRVRHLTDRWYPAGEHAVTWDGRDRDGRRAASGIYFCRLDVGRYRQTIKMMLIR